MYLRFTTSTADQDSHALQGVFQAAFQLRDTGNLAAHEENELNQALDWLKQHLKSPRCLRHPENFRALCWFHPRARKPMQYVWRIVHILQEHGQMVELHKTNDPGIILYQDGWQVVAKPRKKKR